MNNVYGFPFGSLNGDRKYGIDIWRLFLSKLITSGVYLDVATSFQVVAKAGMTTTLKIGHANADGAFVYTDADIDFTHSPAAGAARDDLIVIRADDVDRDPEVVKYENVHLVNGVYPLQRDGSAYELAVAVIHLQSNSSVIMQSMIEDLRLSNAHCGMVVGVANPIDTSQLYAQIQADLAEFKSDEQSDFNAWFATIQGILSGDANANLINLINQRLKLDGSTPMTGALNMGNYPVQLKTAGGVLIGDFAPMADGVKINVYTAGVNPKALYIKNDGSMTLDGHKVWHDGNLKVSEGAPNVATMAEGDIYLEIIPA